MKTPALPDNNLELRKEIVKCFYDELMESASENAEDVEYFDTEATIDRMLALINSQVLKALDEVEGTVIGEEPAPHEDYGGGGRSLWSKQRIALNQLRERYTSHETN